LNPGSSRPWAGRSNPHPIFFRQQQPPDADLAHHLEPVAPGLLKQAVVDEAAGWTQVAFDFNPIFGDMAGIMMAAIQALEKRTADLETIRNLKAENDEIKSRLAKMQTMLEQLLKDKEL
jgi:hypothetical protein